MKPSRDDWPSTLRACLPACHARFISFTPAKIPLQLLAPSLSLSLTRGKTATPVGALNGNSKVNSKFKLLQICMIFLRFIHQPRNLMHHSFCIIIYGEMAECPIIRRSVWWKGSTIITGFSNLFFQTLMGKKSEFRLFGGPNWEGRFGEWKSGHD